MGGRGDGAELEYGRASLPWEQPKRGKATHHALIVAAIGWKNLTIELADGKGTSELSIKEIVASHPIDLFQSSLKKL